VAALRMDSGSLPAGGIAHGQWQPASIYALGRLRAAGGRGKGAIDKRINTNYYYQRSFLWLISV